VDCIENDRRPSDILSRESFENAIALQTAIGGSTNGVLHLLALAAEADVDLSIEDFDEISRRTPKIANLQPGGSRVMNDLHEIGGVPVVLRRLLEADLLHGDAMTVTGRTLAEELAELEDRGALPDDDEIEADFLTVDDPKQAEGAIKILDGNLAPGRRPEGDRRRRLLPRGAGADLRERGGRDGVRSVGRDRLRRRDRDPQRGPTGGRECARCSASPPPSSARATEDVALLTDGRFSGGTRGPMIGHIAPARAADGGPIGLIEDGDHVTVDIPSATSRSTSPRRNWPSAARSGRRRRPSTRAASSRSTRATSPPPPTAR